MRIAHLSDLHFGRHDPVLVEGLADDIIAQQPSLVVVSGDFTQTGTRQEFTEAQEFLRGLTAPVFAVPGNHDLPAKNVVARLLDPYRLYRRFINSELEPFVEIEGVAVAGLKTARRARFELNWANGSISHTQLERLANTFAKASVGSMRIVVAHHPLLEPESGGPRNVEPVRRSATALKAFHALGVRAVLSGHFHLSYVRKHAAEAVREGVPPGPRRAAAAPVLVIQASSTTSTRLRGQPNAYNLLDIAGDEIVVRVREWLKGTWITREELLAHS